MSVKMIVPQLLNSETLPLALEIGDNCFSRPEDRGNLHEVFGLITQGTMARYSPALGLHVKMLPHFVYFSDAQAVGIGGLCEYEGERKAAYLGWFAVSPDSQSKGVGTAMLDHLAALARLCGFSALATVTDAGESNPATKFYLKRGFAVDRPFRFNGLDCVVYRKDLANAFEVKNDCS